jgi:hypothetical protein
MCRQKLEKNSNNLIRLRKFGVILFKIDKFLAENVTKKTTLWAKLLKIKLLILEPLGSPHLGLHQKFY